MTLVRATRCEDVAIPETDLDGLACLGGPSFDDPFDTELEATEASLAATGRPSVYIELDRVDEYGLGELLYAMEVACVLYGELVSVDTFAQPVIEWGRRVACGLLGGGDFREAGAVEEKSRLVVE